MPSERDKASEKPLKWWHFRPLSPFILCTVVIGLVGSLLAPAITSSAYEIAWAEAQPIIWTIIGAVIGGLWEWLRRLNQRNSVIASQHEKPTHWRPRYSVRTLAIVVTLVCCYAACWGPTKTQGVSDVYRFRFKHLPESERTTFDELQSVSLPYFNTSAELPLLVGMEGFRSGPKRYRRYYFWFFGYVAKLPYEREVKRYPLWQDVLDDYHESQRNAKD